MKRLAAIALIVAGVALPACAQRGGSHGGFSGFSGHSAPAFHGGFSAPAFHGGSSAPAFHGGFSSHPAPAFRGGYANHSMPAFRQRFGAPAANRFAGSPRSAGTPFNMARGSRRGGEGNSGDRRDRDRDRRGGFRRPYISPYAYGWGYPYGYLGWVDPYFLSNPDDSGYGDSSQPSNDAYEGNEAQPPEQDQEQYQEQPPQPPGPYRPTYDLQPSPEPVNREAVTLVFKDGRPSEQIHNYALTRSTLYVLDPHHPDIPTDQLDLAATVKVNHDAGVEFTLPEANR